MEEYIVTFSPMALGDIRQAIDYYEGLQKGLGAKFNGRLQVGCPERHQAQRFFRLRTV